MTSTISSKGQVTLPAVLRRHLGWKVGTKLTFEEQGDCLVARPAFDAEAMRSVLGCSADFEPKKTSQDVLARSRGYRREDL